MESQNPILIKDFNEVRKPEPNPEAIGFSMDKPIVDVAKETAQEIAPITRLEIPKPTPSTFIPQEGMTDGQAYTQTILGKVAGMVNYNDNNPISLENKRASVEYTFKLLFPHAQLPTDIGDTTEILFGKRTEDIQEAYSWTMELGRNLISTESIDKYNNQTKDERHKAIINMLMNSKTDRTKLVDIEGASVNMGGMYGAYAIPLRKRVPKDESPEAMAEYEEEYRHKEFMKSPKFAGWVAGKESTPEEIRTYIRTGAFRDEDEARKYFMERMGAGGTDKYSKYHYSPLDMNSEWVYDKETGKYIEDYKLSPTTKASLLHSLTIDEPDVLNTNNVMESRIMNMSDADYANALAFVNAVQVKHKEGAVPSFFRPTVDIFRDKWSSIQEYLGKGQGYDLMHLRNNSESVYRDFVYRTNDDYPFNEDGSVKAKYRDDATALMQGRRDMDDLTEHKNKMTLKAWLDHGAHDYYEVGKNNIQYERGVRSFDRIIRQDYRPSDIAGLQWAGNTVATLADMMTTLAISTIPYVGAPLAFGTLYASEQYELETKALDAGVRPDQARWWSSVYSGAYAGTEYSQVKALEPTIWVPKLEDLKLDHQMLHKAVLVGLGAKSEKAVFTPAEVALLRKARFKWGLVNYAKTTGQETGEEIAQAGLEYGYWSTLVLKNPDIINMTEQTVNAGKQIISAMATMPFVTLFGKGMTSLALKLKGQTDIISHIQNAGDESVFADKNQLYLYLANNSVIHQTDMGYTPKSLDEVPPSIRSQIESLFSVKPEDQYSIRTFIPYGEGSVDMMPPDFESRLNTLRENLIKEGYSNPDEVIHVTRLGLEKKIEMLNEVRKQLGAEVSAGAQAIAFGEKFEPATHPVKASVAEVLFNKLKAMGYEGNMDVVQTAQEATERYGIPEEKAQQAKGFYDDATGTIVLISENNETPAQMGETFTHEAVHSSKEFESLLVGIVRLGISEAYPTIEDVPSWVRNELKRRYKAKGKDTDWIDEASDAEVQAEYALHVLEVGMTGDKSDIKNMNERQIYNVMVDMLGHNTSFLETEDILKAIALMGREGNIGISDVDTQDLGSAEEELVLRIATHIAHNRTDFSLDWSLVEKKARQVRELRERQGSRRETASQAVDIVNEAMRRKQELLSGEKIDEATARDIEAIVREFNTEQLADLTKQESEGFDLANIRSVLPGYLDFLKGKVEEILPDYMKDMADTFIAQWLQKITYGDERGSLNGMTRYGEIRSLQDFLILVGGSIIARANKLKNSSQQLSRRQNLNPVRETAIRVAQMRDAGNAQGAEALLTAETVNNSNITDFEKQVNELVQNIESVRANSPEMTVREAETFYNIREKASSLLAETEKLVPLIDIASEAQEQVRLNRLYRRLARQALAPTDKRKFNLAEVAIGMNSKIDAIIKEATKEGNRYTVATQNAIEAVIAKELSEYFEGNKEAIFEVTQRMAEAETAEGVEIPKVAIPSSPDTVLNTDLGVAVTRELAKSLINEITLTHPKRQRLITKEMSTIWMADTVEQITSQTAKAIGKVAYRPVDVEAQQQLKGIFALAKPNSRNLAWFERSLHGENLKKVLRWKKLYNMSPKRAFEAERRAYENLEKVRDDSNATTLDIQNAIDELVDVQHFAGLKNETPDKFTSALEYADEQLDDEAIAKRNEKLQEIETAQNELSRIINSKKNISTLGKNTMSLKDYLYSVFGTSKTAKKHINKFTTMITKGLNKAGAFKEQFGAVMFLNNVSTKTGKDVPEIRRILRDAVKTDTRFNGAYKPDPNVEMTASQAMQAVLLYEQADQMEKASMTWDMDAIYKALTNEEKAIIEELQNLYKAMGSVLQENVLDKLGIQLKVVENYAPIKLARPMNVAVGKSIRPYVVPSFVLERTQNVKSFDPSAGALEIFESHVAEAAIFIGMQDAVVYARNIFLSPKVMDTMRNKFGDRVADDLTEFIVTVVTQKTARNASITSKDWIARTALAMQTVPLFLNLQSAVRQITSVPAFALENEITHGDVMRAIIYSIKNPNSEALKRLMSSPMMKERYENVSLLELGQIAGEVDKGIQDQGLGYLQKWFNVGLAPNKAVDKFTIGIVAPAIAQSEVDKLNAQGAFNGNQEAVWEEAIARTLGYINATQQSSQIHQRSLAHIRYPTLRAFMAPFTSTLQQFASKELSAFNVWRNATDPLEKRLAGKQFGKVLFLNHVILPMAYTIMGVIYKAVLGDRPDTDEEKNKLLYQLVASMLVGAYSGVFFSGALVKSAIECVTYKMSGVDTPYYGNAIFAPMLNRMFDFNKQYKDVDDFMTVFKDAQWSDPSDVFDVFIEGIEGIAPAPARDLKKIKENYVEEE